MLTLAALAAAGVPGAAAEEARPEAEMLLNLDVLRDLDSVRDRELLRRLPLVDRLRFLQRMRLLGSDMPMAPIVEATPRPAPGENR